MSMTSQWRTTILAFAATLLFVGAGCGPEDDDQQDTGMDDVATDTTDDESDTGPMDVDEEDVGVDTTDEDTTTEDTGDDAGTDTGPEDTGTDDTGGNDAGPACTFFPDDCAEGQNCFITNQGRQCLQTNSDKSEGDSCEGVNDCGDGMQCTQSGVCRAKCDPNNTEENGCPAERSCVSLQNPNTGEALPFGLCQPACTVWPDDSCPENQNCYPTQDGNACLNYSGTAKGESCEGLNDCGEDLICVQTSASEPGTCRAKCNGDNPCQAESNSCQSVNIFPFDVCRPE